MADACRLTITGAIGDLALNSVVSRDASGVIRHKITLPAAKAGTLSTRTSDTAGTLTMEAGHGIVDSDVIDIYWDGGRAYGATVGTVATNEVPFTGASGDVLPTVDSDITAQVQQEIDTDLEGDLLVAMAALCGEKACVGFMEVAARSLTLDLVESEAYWWVDDQLAANPLDSLTITSAVVTQGGDAEATFRLGMLYDSEV